MPKKAAEIKPPGRQPVKKQSAKTQSAKAQGARQSSKTEEKGEKTKTGGAPVGQVPGPRTRLRARTLSAGPPSTRRTGTVAQRTESKKSKRAQRRPRIKRPQNEGPPRAEQAKASNCIESQNSISQRQKFTRSRETRRNKRVAKRETNSRLSRPGDLKEVRRCASAGRRIPLVQRSAQ